MIKGAPQTLLSRAFAAPVDQVFDAWTNAEILRQWWGPHVVEVVECEMDARDGGAYRITMQMPDFQRYPMFGTVQDVDRPVTSHCGSNCPSTLTNGSHCSGRRAATWNVSSWSGSTRSRSSKPTVQR